MDNLVLVGFLGSLGAAMGTVLGAAGGFFVRGLETRTNNILLAFAAGVMLAATFFSLLEPGIERAIEQFDATMPAVLVVIAGLLLGAGVLGLAHRFTPHEHFFRGREGPDPARLSRIWLFVIAIALHNVPEGMAVGVGFAGSDVTRGMPLAIGIGLQNIPEGLAVAVALRSVGYGAWTAFWIAVATGMVQPLGGLFGATAVWVAQPLLPVTLGFAAGAMLFVISREIIPDTHRGEYAASATTALMLGFALMMFLDVTLD